MPSRAHLLFGTDEPVAPLLPLRAGALSAMLDAGNLRYIRWGGMEVIRAISFVVRDTNWGTYAPLFSDLHVEETAAAFRVTYSAGCDSPDGDFRYDASIAASADGTISFEASGRSARGFATNRTGFVVLHPLQGVVGRPLRVTHVSGGTTETSFPLAIDPGIPATDIRELRHQPIDGVTVDVHFEGDAFEMEDHRNWTDASFKTYVRPLSRGYPYRIAAGEALEQRVTLQLTGEPPAAVAAMSGTTIALGQAEGTMPEAGLFVAARTLPLSDQVTAKLAAIRPSFVTARIDARVGGDPFSLVEKLSDSVDAPIGLEIIVPGKAPAAELAPLVEQVAAAGLSPDFVFVTPVRDLKARKANDLPSGEASVSEIVRAARTAFPNAAIGGGAPIGFPEMNRNRPPTGIDFVTHATQATVHAADDISVMETLEALPHLASATARLAGAASYRLGLATIGAPVDTYYATPSKNPSGGRVAMARDEPRQHGLFAAAFALGYTASAAGAGAAAVTLGACGGDGAVLAEDGSEYPVAKVIGWLAALAGRPRLIAEVTGGARIAAIAAGGDTPVLCVANLGNEPATFSVASAQFSKLTLIDAAALADKAPFAIAERLFTSGEVTLDSYAVCRLA